MFQSPKRLYSTNVWSTPAVWKQYNKMAVLHFFLVNSSLIYIQFSLIPTKLFFNGLMSCTRTQAPPLAPTLELKKGLIRVRLFKTHIFKQHWFIRFFSETVALCTIKFKCKIKFMYFSLKTICLSICLSIYLYLSIYLLYLAAFVI